MTDDARDRVVAESQRLFFQFGFRRITMDEISRNLRMSKKTLYVLFPSKKDLVRAVVDSILEPNLAKISTLIQDEKTVAGFFSGSLAVFRELSQSISEPMMSDMRTMPDIWRNVESRRLAVLMRIKDVLERGKRTGEIRPDLHTDLFLRIYIQIVNAVGNPAMMMELNLKPSEMADQVYGVFFRGIMTGRRRKGGVS